MVCMRKGVMRPTPPGIMSPTGLATRLHNLPCALTFQGPLAIVGLVEKVKREGGREGILRRSSMLGGGLGGWVVEAW